MTKIGKKKKNFGKIVGNLQVCMPVVGICFNSSTCVETQGATKSGELLASANLRDMDRQGDLCI